MRKITIWSWQIIIIFSLFLIFLVYWSIFSFKEGYANSVLYWIFFPSTIIGTSFLLYKSFTIVELSKTQFTIYNVGNFNRRIFNISNIELSYGNKVSGYKRPTYYPIVIYDKVTRRKCIILCGRARIKKFDLFWKKIILNCSY